MKYIIYLSSSSIYFYPETLPEMLTGFRKNNEAKHITGMMLYSEGRFLQVLEGDDKAIDVLLRKIKKDKRHHSLMQLEIKVISERIFPSWSMGFKTATAGSLDQLEGYINVADLKSFPSCSQGDHPAIVLLKEFAAHTRM